MQEVNTTLLNYKEMLDICLSGYEKSRQFKTYKHICNLFFKQVSDSQKTRRNQESNIHIAVCVDEKNNSQSNQSFILACLIFLFLKYRSLKVIFEIYSKQQAKSVDREKQITLNVNNAELAQPKTQFYNKISAFINKKQQQYNQSFNFFKEICFKTKYQVQTKITCQILKLRLETYQMVSKFYEKLSFVMTNKNIYLMKNTLSGYKQILSSQEKDMFVKILEQVRNYYTSVHVCINFPQNSLLALLEQSKKQVVEDEVQIQQQEEPLEVGAFKQFEGNTMQYLQKLVIVIEGTKQQIADIIKFLEKTPNLGHMQLYNKNTNQIVLPEAQKLIQTIIEHVPFMKKLAFTNLRMETIEIDLLTRLYVNCPYMVDLSIGLIFQHSIMQTYQTPQNQSFQDKKALELERQKLIILQALRMRNITLENSFQTVKLLLKKGYNFLSALEIIDCIQPICV